MIIYTYISKHFSILLTLNIIIITGKVEERVLFSYAGGLIGNATSAGIGGVGTATGWVIGASIEGKVNVKKAIFNGIINTKKNVWNGIFGGGEEVVDDVDNVDAATSIKEDPQV